MRAKTCRKVALIALCCAGAVTGLALRGLTLYQKPLQLGPTVVHFEISKGESRASVMARLEQSQLFPQGWLLSLVVRFKGHGGCFKAGVHEIPVPASPEGILAGLCASPRAAGHRFTIREGSTIWRVEADLVKAGLANRGELVRLSDDAQNPEIGQLPSAQHLPAGIYPNRMEGYLYPDTYELPHDDAVGALVRRATRRSQQVLGSLSRGGRGSGALGNLHEWVTLASIVQREAVRTDEMPLIASAYLNRLRKDMMLQADPTLTYGPDTWQHAASPTHRRNRSNPFNTYAHKGLPPGPIGAVGKAALQAVRKPARTDYLFFVARGDGSGSHAFSETFEEHRENVERFRAARRGRKSTR